MNVKRTISLPSSNGNLTVSGFQDEYIFDKILKYKKFYELDLLETLSENAATFDGLFVDVGANLGNHTLYFAAMLKRQVISVEPEPTNFSLLEENVKANGLGELVEMHECALGKTSGYVSLNQMVPGNNGTFSASMAESGITCRTLDEVIDGRKVAALKIDVEGFEISVLEGGLETIEASKPVIVLESHTAAIKSAAAKLLEPLGFRCVAISGASDNLFWIHDEANGNVAERVASRMIAEEHRRAERFFNELRGQQSKTLNSLTKINSRLEELEESTQTSTSRESTSDLLESFMSSSQDMMGALQKDYIALDSKVSSLTTYMESGSPELSNLSRQVAANQSFLVEEINRVAGTLSSVRTAIESFESDRTSPELLRAIDKLSGSLVFLIERVRTAFSTIEHSVNKNHATIEELFEAQTSTIEGLERQVSDVSSKVEHQISLVQNSPSDRGEEILKKLAELEGAISRDSNSQEKEPEKKKDFARAVNEELENSWFDEDEASLADKFARLLVAYERMAQRLEVLAPKRWNASSIMSGLSRQLEIEETPTKAAVKPGAESSHGGMREEISPGRPGRPKHDAVRIGIASMAGREEGLRQVVEILSPQADEIFVYLNDMEVVPDILPKRPNVRYFLGHDTGDRGKFKFLDGFEGYYLTCDDDIAYAPFHVQSIIDGIERYGRKAVVGWHGSLFKPGFEQFYDAKSRQVLSFKFLRGQDTPVHLLGTGVCGFHTSTIDIAYEDFQYPNMADVFLAIAAKRQKVPMVVLAHEKDWATPIEVGPSISSVSLKRDKDSSGGLDVAATATKLVKDEMPWEALSLTPNYRRKPMTLAFVGRTDKDRWKKGGILKSAHLTRDMLERFQVRTLLEDIETGDPKNFHGQDADVVLIYVGDPERPDFKNVEALIAHHAKKGRQVVVNLSYNAVPSRSEFIGKKMKELRGKFGPRVWLMVFTEAMLSAPDLAEIHDWLIVIPKTISLPDEPVASFGRSKGIFLGDIAKLSNENLLGYPAQAWIAAIKRALPDVPLYAVQQYKPKEKVELGIDEIWPFLRGEEFANKIGDVRLMVSLVKYATFEMVPLEVASLGIPVVYPEMPQSLGEYLGLSGFSVRSPEQLERVLPTLYSDPIVWRSHSQSGIERAWSSELNRLGGQTYLRLIDLVERNK